MIAKGLIGTTILALMASVSACSCLEPPPLSQCAVRDNEAALLVRVMAVQTFQCSRFDGSSIADVSIIQVFKDNTNLDLKRGSDASIETVFLSSLCGFPMRVGTQYIIFAQGQLVPDNNDKVEESGIGENEGSTEDTDEEDEPVVKTARRLRATEAPSPIDSAKATNGASVSARGFTDGDTCFIPTADLYTFLCAGNVVNPTKEQIDELTTGCAATTEDYTIKHYEED